jgi:hypothetical protein
MQPAPPTSPAQQIPSTVTIRRRLAELAQERSVLRQLLRVAERVERSTGPAPAAKEAAHA